MYDFRETDEVMGFVLGGKGRDKHTDTHPQRTMIMHFFLCQINTQKKARHKVGNVPSERANFLPITSLLSR